MNCTRLRQILDAHLDAELDAATAEEIARHLTECATCSSLHDERVATIALVRAESPYYTVPASLRRAVHRSLSAAGRDAGPGTDRPAKLQVSAIIAAAALVGGLMGYWIGHPAPDNPLREQVVASHAASLGAQRSLVDVLSTDRHAIKPWFQGKVDFAPVVRDLSAAGFDLTGARLDHVADRQAVAVVYRIRSHVINLFVWRAAGAGTEGVGITVVRGFSVATWADGGLRYAAVSDVDLRDLERFVQLVLAPP